MRQNGSTAALTGLAREESNGLCHLLPIARHRRQLHEFAEVLQGVLLPDHGPLRPGRAPRRPRRPRRPAGRPSRARGQ